MFLDFPPNAEIHRTAMYCRLLKRTCQAVVVSIGVNYPMQRPKVPYFKPLFATAKKTPRVLRTRGVSYRDPLAFPKGCFDRVEKVLVPFVLILPEFAVV